MAKFRRKYLTTAIDVNDLKEIDRQYGHLFVTGQFGYANIIRQALKEYLEKTKPKEASCENQP